MAKNNQSSKLLAVRLVIFPIYLLPSKTALQEGLLDASLFV